MSKIDVICDLSQRNLPAVPRDLLELNNLQMLYLENNAIEFLPSDLFQKLPRLSWLDLRNNRLKEIPTGIANHQCLDTLLLENNHLEKLPNELGLCPNLLVLQINGNPLKYPQIEILQKGAIATCEYLKAQFDKENGQAQNTYSEVSLPTDTASCPSEPVRLPSKKKISIQELLRRASTAAKVLQRDTPVMTVKGLSPKNSITTPIQKTVVHVSAEQPNDLKIIKKKPLKFCPKIAANTHYNSNKYLNVRKAKPNKERVIDQQVKDIWLAKLKELLEQQEKLLQQERNLQSLNSWRLQKKMEPIRKIQKPKREVPYDTDPDYETMLQREDLYKQVDTMVRRKKRFTKTVDMRKMISEIVLQLKALEAQNGDGSPKNELERNDQSIKKINDSGDDRNNPETRAYELARAESEIRKIIDLHKKVTTLQAMNDTST